MVLFRQYCSVVFVLCALPFAVPVPGHAETLEEAVQAAMLRHPSALSARAGIEGAAEARKSELSGYFPEVSMTGAGGRLFGDNATSRGLSVTRGSGYSYLWEGSITARQMLFDGFETGSRVDSAYAKEKSADMNLEDIRENLAFRAAQAYLNVMRTNAGLYMLQEHSKKVADYLKRIKASVDEGASDEAEYQQARDVSVILDGFIADYQGQVKAAEAEYFEATGYLPEGRMATAHPSPGLIPGDSGRAVEQALLRHPSLRSAVFSSQSIGHDVDSERAALYPDVDGELSYLKTDKEDIIGGEAIDAKAVVRLNWNFETGGGQLARIRKKKHEYSEATARVDELKRQIERGVRLAYSELETARRQMKNLEARYNLNAKLFETYKVQFDGARITLLQLMQADNQFFNTRLERLGGEYRVLIAQYAVLASMGMLHESLNLASLEPESGSHGQN